MPTNSNNESISAHDEGEDLPRMGGRAVAALPCTVPAGWKLVPIEPTPEMIAAMAVIEASSHQVTTFDDGDVEVTELIGMSGAVEAYEAMLAAADPYPKGEVVGPCVCGSWPGGKCLRCAQLLSAAPQSDGWISVDERLPAHEQEVICTGFEGNDPTKKRWQEFAAFHENGTFYHREEGDELYPPTHWREMFAPPTTQTEGLSHGE